MPKAYSYIRMSTEAQAARGESLRRQLELSKNYASKHGLELQEGQGLFQDLGISAFKGGHIEFGALGRFMKAVEDNQIESGSYLLVESLDRISRERIIDAISIFLRIINAGITIVTLADNVVYAKESINQPSGYGTLFISLTIMMRANEESETKSLRLRHAWTQKRAQVATKKLSAMAPAWLRLTSDRKSFDILEDRAEVVRQIFADASNGMGALVIVRRLNAANYQPWGWANGWQTSYIKKILGNRAVLGEYLPHTLVNGRRKPLEPVTGYYPSIVSEDAFHAAQFAIRTRRGGGGRRGPMYSNLFSGLLRCGYCGTSIHYLNKGPKPKGGLYLRCNAAVRGTNCPATNWSYPHFETNFLTLVKEVDFGQFVASNAARMQLHELTQSAISVAAQLESEQRRLDNLLSALESTGAAGQVAISDRINEVAQSIAELKVTHSKLKADIEIHTARIASVADHQNNARQLIALLKTKSGEELYRLRANIAQALRESIGYVQLWSDGYIPSTEAIDKRSQGLAQSGLTTEEIQQYNEHYQATPRPPKTETRAYGVHFRNGEVRTVKPHPIDDHSYTFMSSTDGIERNDSPEESSIH